MKKIKKTPASFEELLEQFPRQLSLLLEQVQDSLKEYVATERITWSLDTEYLYAKVSRKTYKTKLGIISGSFLEDSSDHIFKLDPLYQQIKWLLIDDAISKFGDRAAADQGIERARLLLKTMYDHIPHAIKEHI